MLELETKTESSLKERLVYERPKVLTEKKTHYCAGCGHGIIHKLIAQTIEKLGVRDRSVIIAPVGCSVILYDYFNIDSLEMMHGRAPAAATGLKRALPDRLIVSYQGDGDLLSIGMGETIHAANRGENITVIFVNNAIYGMTGGQMAPTSLMEQKTTTTKQGRTPELGFPIQACELINTLEAPYYIRRCSVHNVENVRKTRRAIEKAFKYQLEGRGYSFIEILSMCPTGWEKSPVDSANWIEQKMKPRFPLEVLRDRGKPE